MLPDLSSCRVLFSDIDGTLLSSSGQITPRTLSALRSWTASGRDLVLCSSRSRDGILPIARRYQLSCDLITLGGGAVYGQGGELLFMKGMPASLAGQIAAFMASSGLPCAWNAYTPAHWYTPDPSDPRVLREARVTGAVPQQVSDPSFSSVEPVCKFLLICDPGQADPVRSAVSAAFPACQVTCSSSFLVEVNPAGVDKGTGVRLYCEKKGIPLSRACAFGDQFNDTAMLSAVAYPVLMGNAPDALKARFPYHTLDHDHDGIAAALDSVPF